MSKPVIVSNNSIRKKDIHGVTNTFHHITLAEATKTDT